MNLKLCVYSLLVFCAFSGIITDENDKDNEANKKDRAKDMESKMLQNEAMQRDAAAKIQELQQQKLTKKDEKFFTNFLNQPKELAKEKLQGIHEAFGVDTVPDIDLQSDEKIDAQSILKKFKIQETFHKTWPSESSAIIKPEFVVAENSLGFQFDVRAPRGYPRKRVVLWKSEALGTHFPLSFSHEGNAYKLKTCDAFPKLKIVEGSEPNVQENQIKIVYGNDSPCWHASFAKYLKSLIISDSDTITLILTQEQPEEKPTDTPAVTRKLLLDTLESERTSEKNIEPNPNPVYISVMHNNVQITNQLQNLLENSTKIDFENLQKMWGEIDTTNLSKVVAREKKRAQIVRAGLFSLLGVPLLPTLFSLFSLFVMTALTVFGDHGDKAHDRLIEFYPWPLVTATVTLYSIIFWLIILIFVSQAKLRATTLQKFAKY